MKMVSLVLCTLIVVTGCKERKAPEVPANEYHNDSIPFYPVHDFLQSEIHKVSTTPYFMYQTVVENGHTDSTVLDRPAFLAAASIFTAYSFEDSTVKKFYKEQVFADDGTNSITLHYTTQNKALPVQSAMVLLHPETKQVKRVMLEVVQGTPDSTVIYKLGWKANAHCSIITITQKKGEPEHARQTNLVWNGN